VFRTSTYLSFCFLYGILCINTLKKGYSRIPTKISSRIFGNPFIDFGNPKMVFEGKKRFLSIPKNPLRVSDSNKLGNRKRFSRLGNASKGFLSFGNFSLFPSLLLFETLRGFPKRSETFFHPRKPFLDFRNRQMGFRMFGNLFWPVFENTFFLECSQKQTNYFFSYDPRFSRGRNIFPKNHKNRVFMQIHYLRKETPVFAETFNTY